MGQVVFTATLSFDRNSTDQLSFIQTFVQIKVHPISTCRMAHLIYVLPVVRRWTIFVMETACSVPCVDTSAAFIYHVEAIPWSGCIHHDPVLVSVWTDLPTLLNYFSLGNLASLFLPCEDQDCAFLGWKIYFLVHATLFFLLMQNSLCLASLYFHHNHLLQGKNHVITKT